MLTNSLNVSTKQVLHLVAIQPHGLVFKPYVQPDGLVRLIDNYLVFDGLYRDLRGGSAGQLCLFHEVIPFLFVLTPRYYHFRLICGTQ